MKISKEMFTKDKDSISRDGAVCLLYTLEKCFALMVRVTQGLILKNLRTPNDNADKAIVHRRKGIQGSNTLK